MSKRILLIEPDVILARQYATELSDAGYLVDVYHDAAGAMSRADTAMPDLVIVEPMLAEHSGFEFLHEFRSYDEWLATPVIMLSRVPEQQLPGGAQLRTQYGIQSYLYKPDTSLKKLVERAGALLAES